MPCIRCKRLRRERGLYCAPCHEEAKARGRESMRKMVKAQRLGYVDWWAANGCYGPIRPEEEWRDVRAG